MRNDLDLSGRLKLIQLSVDSLNRSISATKEFNVEELEESNALNELIRKTEDAITTSVEISSLQLPHFKVVLPIHLSRCRFAKGRSVAVSDSIA